MTHTQLLIACGSISVWLISFLVLYLRYKFQWLEFDKRWKEWIDSGTELKKGWPNFHANLREAVQSKVLTRTEAILPTSKPKRRKWRDNKGEV